MKKIIQTAAAALNVACLLVLSAGLLAFMVATAVVVIDRIGGFSLPIDLFLFGAFTVALIVLAPEGWDKFKNDTRTV